METSRGNPTRAEVTPRAKNTPRIGGSFAPPLTEQNLVSYRELADRAPEQVKLEMHKLCDMVETFYLTPKSTLQGTPHPVGNVKGKNGRVVTPMIVPLQDEEVERMWNLVPWNDEVSGEHINECEVLSKLFDGIHPQENKALRDAAFHLLWYAVELANDREPITNNNF